MTLKHLLFLFHLKNYRLLNKCALKNSCTKKELQSLLGSLLYVTKCIKYSRFFLNRMLSLLRENYDNSKITLNETFKRDLQWFNTFLPVYNGITFFQYIPTRNVYLDAWTTGLGAIYEVQVYALPLPKEWQTANIASLEMINILVALKVWHLQWAGHRVLIHCDNQAVVLVLNTGKSRDDFLSKIAKNLFMWLSAFNIDLQVVHVAGNVIQSLICCPYGSLHVIIFRNCRNWFTLFLPPPDCQMPSQILPRGLMLPYSPPSWLSQFSWARMYLR